MPFCFDPSSSPSSSPFHVQLCLISVTFLRQGGTSSALFCGGTPLSAQIEDLVLKGTLFLNTSMNVTSFKVLINIIEVINLEDTLWNIFTKEHLRCAVLCLLQQGAEAMSRRFWGGGSAFPPRQVREENTVNTVSDNSVQAHQGAEADEGGSRVLAIWLLGQDGLQHEGRPG